jgi:hypothetical protein
VHQVFSSMYTDREGTPFNTLCNNWNNLCICSCVGADTDMHACERVDMGVSIHANGVKLIWMALPKLLFY